MQEREQILYMQTRIMQLAAERWGKTISQVSQVFAQYGLAQMIEDEFDGFHVEGDEAVFSDLMDYLRLQGGMPDGTVEA